MMLALTPIVDHLRAAGLLNVEGVLEIPTADQLPRALPAHYVVPTSESAGGNPMAGARDQAVDVTFSVLVVLEGSRRNQAGISEEVRDRTKPVIDAITGWTHPEASCACDYLGGRLGSASGRVVTWEVRFRSRYRLRKAS